MTKLERDITLPGTTTGATMSRLTRLPWVLLALLFLLEAWIWDHVGPWIRRAVAALPLKGLKLWLEQHLATLPPYGALAVFLGGGLVLAPFKFLEICAPLRR